MVTSVSGKIQSNGLGETREEYSMFLQPQALCIAPRHTPAFTRPFPKAAQPSRFSVTCQHHGPWLPTVSLGRIEFPTGRDGTLPPLQRHQRELSPCE